MPIHPRQRIREAAKAALLGATAADARVYETRMVPFKQLQLPAIAVYCLEETVDPGSLQSSARKLERELSLEVVGSVRVTDDVDDVLDSLAAEIETAMHADFTLGGACDDLLMQSTDVAIEIGGDKPMGQVSVIFTIYYETQAPDVTDAELDDFERAGVTYDLNGTTHPDAQAKDLIDLEE